MYRRAAAQGPLQGVGSGPYTGGVRVVDAGKLSRAAKQRLEEALSGRAEPTPIAYDRASTFASSLRAVWLAVVALAVLVLTFARGFDDATSAWQIQPGAAFGVYLVASLVFCFSIHSIVRRRYLVGGEALRPGRYLLPLDVVEIAPVGENGRQRITVRPLGDARDAVIRGEGRKAELVIVFGDTSQVTFPLRADPGGAITLRRLEHAQRLLEDLTFDRDLSQALANDPFFDVRADGSWSSVAASDDDAPLSRARRSFVVGRAGVALACVATVVLAFGTFRVRNAVARRLIAVHEARVERERLAAELSAKRAREAEEEDRRREEAMNATLPSPKTAATCLAAFKEKASSDHPEVTKIVEAILAKVERERDPRVPVVWQRMERSLVVPSPIGAEQWAERESTTSKTFARVVSETCPPNIMRFAHDDADVLPQRPGWGLFIEYVVSWPRDKKYAVRRRGAPGETFHVMGVHVTFDVKLLGPGDSGSAKFRLTMPPPEKLVMAHRAQSIFPSSLEDDGTYDERVYESMTARAFDRLYDEVWSLFFAGNPKVPLDRSPTSTHTGADL